MEEIEESVIAEDDEDIGDQEAAGGEIVFVQRKTRKNTKKKTKTSRVNTSVNESIKYNQHSSMNSMITVPSASTLRNIYPPMSDPRVQ